MQFKNAIHFLLLLSSVSSYAQVKLVKDIYPGTEQSYPWNLTVYKNKLYFYAYNKTDGQQLWVVDTSDNAQILKKMSPLSNPGILQMWGDMGITTGNLIEECNGKLYFCASDGNDGPELWEYDGITPPKMTKNINTATAPINDAGSQPTWLTAIGKKLYFAATTDTGGRELWEYNTVSNAARAIFALPGIAGSDASNLMVYNDKLYFNGIKQMHVYDPITDNVLNIDIVPTTQNSDPRRGDAYRYSALFYSANDGVYGEELYKCDLGNMSSRLTDINPGNNSALYSGIKSITIYKDGVYFAAHTSNTAAYYLYKYDTNTKKAAMVDPKCYGVSFMIECQGKLMFRAFDSTHGIELWEYDGVAAPHMIVDVNPGKKDGFPTWMTEFNGGIYFAAQNDTSGYELHKYTPLPAGVANQANPGFKVYPNPTNGKVRLDLDRHYDEITIEVKSLTGQVISSQAYSNISGADVNIDAPAGLYIIGVRDNNSNRTNLRVIKMD